MLRGKSWVDPMLQKGEEKNRPWDVSSYLGFKSDLIWGDEIQIKPTCEVFDTIMSSRMLSTAGIIPFHA
jgi:hypothetical protein